MGFRVSKHAIERYCQRVEAVSHEAARKALSTETIRLGAKLGARFVRLASGHRVALENGVVVTVHEEANYRRQIRRVNLGYEKRFRKFRHD